MKSTRSRLPLAILVLFSACRGVTGLGDLSFADEEQSPAAASSSGGGGVCEPGAVEACAYSGPPGTEGAGVCRAPTRVCSEDGAGYGACAGEVLPKVEDCGTPMEDESCDGRVACDGAGLWALGFGEGAGVNVCGVAADFSGNVFVAGDFKAPSIDLGGGPLDGNANEQRVFVAKLDPSGAHLWSREIKGASEERCQGMAVDSEGNVLLAGYYQDGGPDFGGGPLTSAILYDGFVAKLDGQGAHVFSQSISGWGDQSVRNVAVDGEGTVFVVGRFQETIKIGPYTLQTQVQNEGFVAKFDTNGAPFFAQRYSASAYLHGMDIAVDSATGDAVFSGQIGGSGNFGGVMVSGSTGNLDSFVARLSADGSIAWARSIGGSNQQEVNSLAFDREGGVLVGGQFESEVNFGSGYSLSSNGKDGFVLRIDAAGVTTWAKAFAGLNEQLVTSVAVDGAGNAVVSGRFNTELTLNETTQVSAGSNDLFVAKLEMVAGNTVWLRPMGGLGNEAAWAVNGDALGNTLIMGKFDGDLDFGLPSGLLKSAAGDAFIAKLAP